MIQNNVELEVHIITVPMGSACVTASRTFVQLSINKGVRVLESVNSDHACKKVLELSTVVELGVSIQLEVRRSSSRCSQDWHSPSSGRVYRSRDWENYQIHWIKEVHRERSGQQPVSGLDPLQGLVRSYLRNR